ncbi:hypothetical protein QBC34DRAFT_215919 [Podospora aff. communis PSN243]|uniref:Uncharacterized protein n=1 Tax=Podospora aff. communis PSN243 TaxID=3040156 RepID=A0AAV9GX83_9PEZI|nr:hypothetical protein QBC34DRAFT_215919 [Podospora aff. communis PSN243]
MSFPSSTTHHLFRRPIFIVHITVFDLGEIATENSAEVHQAGRRGDLSLGFHRTKASSFPTPIPVVVIVVRLQSFDTSFKHVIFWLFDAIFCLLFPRVVSFRGFFFFCHLPSHNNIRSSCGEPTKTVRKGRNVNLMTMNEERYPTSYPRIYHGTETDGGGYKGNSRVRESIYQLAQGRNACVECVCRSEWTSRGCRGRCPKP